MFSTSSYTCWPFVWPFSLEKCLFSSFVHFLIRSFALCYWVVLRSWYIFHRLPSIVFSMLLTRFLVWSYPSCLLFAFFCLCFGHHIQKMIIITVQTNGKVFPNIFILLVLQFWVLSLSLIHFELNFMGYEIRSSFFLLHIDIQSFLHHLLKKLSSPHWHPCQR